jgi:hypothetical protein
MLNALLLPPLAQYSTLLLSKLLRAPALPSGRKRRAVWSASAGSGAAAAPGAQVYAAPASRRHCRTRGQHLTAGACVLLLLALWAHVACLLPLHTLCLRPRTFTQTPLRKRVVQRQCGDHACRARVCRLALQRQIHRCLWGDARCTGQCPARRVSGNTQGAAQEGHAGGFPAAASAKAHFPSR